MDQNPNPNTQENKYMPPAPAGYAGQQVSGPKPVENPARLDKPQLPIELHVEKRKKQAKLLIIASIVFASLFIFGVVLLAVTALSDNSDVPKENLTIDEQLKRDVNTLGLGIINYAGSGKVFTLETDDVGELRLGYLPLDFKDPRTDRAYTLTTAIPEEGELQYVAGGTCNEDDSVSQSGSKTSFAIRVRLESETLYCLDKSEVTQPKTPKP